MMEPLRERIQEEPVIGTWLNTNSPVVAELLASLGFDFLTVDAEHSAIGITEAQALYQAIAAGDSDCTPLVRLPETNYETVKRHLDAGAKGVIAPLINTPEQAQEVADASKYPPEGQRGVGFARSNTYGANFDASVPYDNDETLVCVQIEHRRAIENIDEILAVDGIDAALFGPYDLSASLNVTGQFDHPKFEEAINTAEAACREHDIILGTHVIQPDVNEATQRIEDGYRLLAYSLDITVLSEVFGNDLDEIRSAISDTNV
jgi:2-dehydro-3-deoxyglucarate aldolase